MSESRKTNRREFLARTAGSVGALALGSTCFADEAKSNLDAAKALVGKSAHDQLRIGIVGVGSRGGWLMNWVNKLASTHNVAITAVGDLLERRRNQAADRVHEWCGKKPALCRTPNELFDRKDVDAVIIATADFQHCYHAAQAVLAGKDVYVEKPFGCDFDQVSRAHAVISKSDRVFQVGTQSRGNGKYESAAKFVQSGKLGQVTYVEISEPLFQQRWRIPESERSVTVKDVDWQEFLCYLPKSLPFDARHYSEFRLFWPFSSGPFCQWMSHRIDLVNLVLGKLPSSAVALGGVYLWQDGRSNPDTVQCLLEYPGGTLVSYHLRLGNSANGRAITFYGTTGTLELESGVAHGNGMGGLVVKTEPNAEAPVFRIDHTKVLRGKKAGGEAIDPGVSVDFMGDFFECVRTRRKTKADIEAALGHSVATILANQAYRTGRRMNYDAGKREMRPA